MLSLPCVRSVADIRSRPSTDTYRDEYERIFGHKRRVAKALEAVNEEHQPNLAQLAAVSRRVLESLDSHPAAD